MIFFLYIGHFASYVKYPECFLFKEPQEKVMDQSLRPREKTTSMLVMFV